MCTNGFKAYTVEQRTPEIGIRLSLGAETSRVKNMFVFQGMTVAIIGVIIGISFALNLTSLITRFLFSVKPWDPAVFVTVPIVLSAVALLAVWIPTRRASRVNAMDALRYE